MDSKNTIHYGIGLGNAIAVCLSWTTWHSIWWTIIHGLLGWIYVIYYGVNYL